MTTWRCAGCQTVYSVWLSACPRCHGNSFEEVAVPKLRLFGDQAIVQVSALVADVVEEAPVVEDAPVVEVPDEPPVVVETPVKRSARKS